MSDITKYAAMAKIRINEDERDWLESRVSMLTDSFGALDAIDTNGVKPLASVLDIKNVLREDISEKTISHEVLLSVAPEQYDGYFQVPKTVE